MTVFNLGSINVDHLYQLGHLPQPGETLSSLGYSKGLGGKGANQSVAALRAGAEVVHIGAIAADDGWTRGALEALGLSTAHVAGVDAPTGHAIVALDQSAENLIIIHAGANHAQSESALAAAFASAKAGDILLLQNETSHQAEAAKLARAAGLKVFYSAAPFDLAALQAVLPHATHLLMNALEAKALEEALDMPASDLPVAAVVITRGSEGADWVSAEGVVHVPALRVEAIDTTGAGDCFAGSLAARLDQGDSPQAALEYAAAAAALQVTRLGAATSMPELAEVRAILSEMR